MSCRCGQAPPLRYNPVSGCFVCRCGQTRVDEFDVVADRRRASLEQVFAVAVARPHPDSHLGAVGGE